jgi:hypothetical protein
MQRLNQHGGADPATADPKALGDLLMTWVRSAADLCR